MLEVIDAAKRVTGREVPFELAERREGDPPRLVADASRARAVLGWDPKQPSLDTIVRSAWDWMQAHPDGSAARSGPPTAGERASRSTIHVPCRASWAGTAVTSSGPSRARADRFGLPRPAHEHQHLARRLDHGRRDA